MTELEIGIFMLAGVFALVYVGLWIPFALMTCSFVGIWMLKGSPEFAGKLMALVATEAIAKDVFAIIPLYILLGYLGAAAGLGKDAFNLANIFFRRLPGGLGVSTVAANAGFAAITGVSVASAVIFTRAALQPMLEYGYRKNFVLGLIAGSSVLGMLIPPSLLLILYATLSDQSVGDLFVAGIMPGVMLAALLGITVVAMALWFPNYVYSQDASQTMVRDRKSSESASHVLLKSIPLLSTIILVLGGIYGGFFTTREAAAMGCLFIFIILLFRGKANVKTVLDTLYDSAAVTTSIFLLIITAQMFARMLSISGLSSELGMVITVYQLGPIEFLFIYAGVAILLGTILDSASVMIILVPLAIPFALGLDIDLIWMGIVTILAVEIGLLTPPFGMSVFAIKSALNDPSVTLSDIFLGAAPFIAVMLMILTMIIIFPQLTSLL